LTTLDKFLSHNAEARRSRFLSRPRRLSAFFAGIPFAQFNPRPLSGKCFLLIGNPDYSGYQICGSTCRTNSHHLESTETSLDLLPTSLLN